MTTFTVKQLDYSDLEFTSDNDRLLISNNVHEIGIDLDEVKDLIEIIISLAESEIECVRLNNDISVNAKIDGVSVKHDAGLVININYGSLSDIQDKLADYMEIRT